MGLNRSLSNVLILLLKIIGLVFGSVLRRLHLMRSNIFDRSKPDDSWVKNHNYAGNHNFRGYQNHLSREGNRFSSKDITSFYVTNFPKYVLMCDLWRACNQIGKVIDVFISSKKSRIGKCFGFIRFVGITNIDKMIKNLCEVWFCNQKTFASLPRFSN